MLFSFAEFAEQWLASNSGSIAETRFRTVSGGQSYSQFGFRWSDVRIIFRGQRFYRYRRLRHEIVATLIPRGVVAFESCFHSAQQSAIIEIVETRCARCNSPMICQPEGECWCAELPPRLALPQSGRCLCRHCLEHDLKSERELPLKQP
jgi:hypothetical protein